MDYPGLDEGYYSLFEPVGVRARTTEELDHILADENRYNYHLDRYDAFVKENIGTDNSYENQARTILSVVDGVTGLTR